MSYNRDSRKRHSRPYNTGKNFPDRWLSYDNCGRDMAGTRFVAFKTPLDKSFFEKKGLHSELVFEVNTLISYANRVGKKMGLVIDLTNTDRYYNKQEWADNNVEYRKIYCPGHEVHEREDVAQQFIGYVREFVSNPLHADKMIGVHCTHGLNRTGYLICRYLIEDEGFTAADAISLFEFSRGHPIERKEYKKSLYEAELKHRNKEESGKEDMQDSPTEKSDSVSNEDASKATPSTSLPELP